jgi:competence protein ComEA
MAPSTKPSEPRWLLRRLDQAAVGAIVAVALVAMGLWWVGQGGLSGRLVEFERLPPRTAQFQVDINSANWPELSQLPGIGESLARRIVESREQNGPFADHQELRRVRGIGPRTLERISPYLRAMPETANVAGP